MFRFFDIVFSGLAVLVLLPIFLPICLLLRVTGEKEIFYLQDRVGKNGKDFKLRKFATMLKDSPNMGSGTITIANDPRVLPFGKFLRITKINELPQLLNVLAGDMSLIGPRPLTRDGYELYDERDRERIYSVKPGLSGIGSIIFRNEEALLKDRNDVKAFHRNVIGKYKQEVELWFLERNHLGIYFLLIVLTIYCLFTPRLKVLWSVFPSLPIPPEKLDLEL